jgi:hypothetical protein
MLPFTRYVTHPESEVSNTELRAAIIVAVAGPTRETPENGSRAAGTQPAPS